MTVTWTSGYDIKEAYPFVEWGMKWSPPTRTAAGTVTFDRESLCGMDRIKDPFYALSSVYAYNSMKFLRSLQKCQNYTILDVQS